jgi:tetratricopeptide (TPR) repeat protein
MSGVQSKDVVLKRPENVTGQEVSLFVMAKNAESVIVRLLDNVGPYIQEVVMVLNDTSDKTAELVGAWCREHRKPFIYVEVKADTHPDLYIMDTKATYMVGRSLNGEEYAGPFTEVPILADWAEARNQGWGLCTLPWKLFLDADDYVLDPETIPGLCQALSDNGADMAATAYHFHSVGGNKEAHGKSFRERIARNTEGIRWVYPIHEVLNGASMICHVDGSLTVEDRRDNAGAGIRVPGRNFKILYHLARSNDWDVSARVLVYLIVELRHQISSNPKDLIPFADALLELYMKRSEWVEERGWAYTLVAEIYERDENLERAKELYRKSLGEHMGAKTAFRLCRIHHKLKEWEDCIAAYLMGVDYQKNVRQVLDDGPLFVEMSKILVASAYHELGMYDEGLKVCDEALKIFPENDALLQLREMLVQEETT